MTLVHGTCVAMDGMGVLLRGPSGSGKSDLALRLIDLGARLVADDQVELSGDDERVTASAPAALAGLIEARGLGILRIDHLATARVALVVDLVASDTIERLPQLETASICGIELPLLRIDPFAASAAAKLRFALRVAAGSIGSIMRPR
jgi:serine kinase of HPr protein (carbohydrate metabolism regulator)